MTRILLLDDEAPILAALRRLLRARPCAWGGLAFDLTIETYTTPAAALARLARVPFDLFLSDYRMPGMDGVEFLRLSKVAQPEAARLIVSGHADLGALARAINEVGIAAFLPKPWNDAELVAGIGRALAERQDRLETRARAGHRGSPGTASPQESERRRLEALEPGITRVNWGPDGAVLLDADLRRDE